MDYLSAAYKILERAKRPLHYKEITKRALAEGLITPGGLTPEASMGSRLYVDTKNEDSRFERAGKAVFSIRPKARTDDIAKRVKAINDTTRRNLKRRLQAMTAVGFEAFVRELLIAIGFEESTVVMTPYQRDRGIDVRGTLKVAGVAEVNAAVQAKKWKGNVGAEIVRNVRGSLTAHEQGIIITTSGFSKGAKEEATALGKTPISLVDGNKIIDLLFEHSVGVNRKPYEVFSVEEEWWLTITGEGLEDGQEDEELPGVEPESLAIELDYPVPVRALNKPDTVAELLNAEGHIRYADQVYNSPSTAGKEVSGWKSCNGWKYWQYQHPDLQEWRLIDDLRQK